jgi:hypothetical protein
VLQFLRDHLSLIDKAIWRRFVTTETSLEEYVESLAAVVDKCQEVLDTEDDESTDVDEEPASR